MMHGIDVSNWNENIERFFPECDFIIMKATEGTTFADKTMASNYTLWTGRDFSTPACKPYGFYHYARPDTGNTADGEAEWFLRNIKPHIGHALLALDWEGKSLKTSPEWALQWLNYVYEKTGVKPLLYTGKFEANSGKYNKIAEADFGLWVASWEENKPTIVTWPVTALWQYSANDIDRNYFFGNESAWDAYTNPGKEPKQIKPGMKVIPTSRTAYDGTLCAEFLLSNVYDVMEVNGDRIVFGKNGAVTAAYHADNLQVV